MLEKVVYPLLLKTDPEKAHGIAKWGMKHIDNSDDYITLLQ